MSNARSNWLRRGVGWREAPGLRLTLGKFTIKWVLFAGFAGEFAAERWSSAWGQGGPRNARVIDRREIWCCAKEFAMKRRNSEWPRRREYGINSIRRGKNW